MKLKGFAVTLAGLLAVVATALIIDYVDARFRLSRFTLDRYIAGNPVFVFKEVNFQKFLVSGTADSADRHFANLSVMSVRGTAEFGASVRDLRVDRAATSIPARTLVLTIPRRDVLRVDVRIPAGEVSSLYTVRGVPFSEEEARAIAEPAATAAAAVAGTVAAGAGVGKSRFLSLRGLAGQGLGAAVGALAAGGGTWLFTRTCAVKVLTGIKPGSPTFGGDQATLDAARFLIASDLVGGDAADPSTWEAGTSAYYAKELERRLAAVFHDSGWSSVRLETR